jgi:hypothetical protein
MFSFVSLFISSTAMSNLVPAERFPTWLCRLGHAGEKMWPCNKNALLVLCFVSVNSEREKRKHYNHSVSILLVYFSAAWQHSIDTLSPFFYSIPNTFWGYRYNYIQVCCASPRSGRVWAASPSACPSPPASTSSTGGCSGSACSAPTWRSRPSPPCEYILADCLMSEPGFFFLSFFLSSSFFLILLFDRHLLAAFHFISNK